MRDTDQPKTIALVITRDKAAKHISSGLLKKADGIGITLKFIDDALEPAHLEEGNFDVILQKIKKQQPEWEARLQKYQERHANCRVMDDPKHTLAIRNRKSMLEPLSKDWICEADPATPGPLKRIRCSVPLHTILEDNTSFTEAETQLAEEHLHYPLVAKNFWTDGRDGSHRLAVIHTPQGLQQLIEGNVPGAPRPPALLQQYVDHGACLFKVYVLGKEAVVVKRPSLNLNQPGDDDSEDQPAQETALPKTRETTLSSKGQKYKIKKVERRSNGQGVLDMDMEVMDRVSAYPRGIQWGETDLAPEGCAPEPPAWLWQGLSEYLREQLHLHLFNFDVIVPMDPPLCQRGLVEDSDGARPAVIDGSVEEGLVYLIDVNYWPGYEKLPGYEDLMIRFFQSLFPDSAKTAPGD